MRARVTSLFAALLLAVMLAPGAAAVGAISSPPATAVGSIAVSQGDSAETTSPADGAESTAEPGESEEAAETLRGSIRGPDREPVPGLTITVTQDGTEVGTGTTNDNGQWEVPLPGPGTYSASLDPAELPEGVAPKEEGGEEVTGVIVRPGANQGVIFQLAATGDGEEGSAPAAGGITFLDRFLQLTVEGIKFGAIIAITAVGLSLVFGTTRLINFAHGEFVTFGAVMGYFLSVSPVNLPLIVAAVLAMLLTALLAGVMDLTVFRPMRRKSAGMIQQFIVAIGLALVIRHVLLVFFGSRRRGYDEYNLQTALDFGLFRITPRDLVVTILAFVIMGLVAFMLQRTRIGKAMRAVNDNEDLASASGINVQRVVLTVWVVGGALAGIGGVMFGLTQTVYTNMGFQLLLLMFAAVILGGLGNAYGAMLGALVIGLVSQYSTLWFPSSLQNMWALLVMILVLLFRPQGILGRRERVG
ncbi:branched-chain amino acid ABC transporter permease [Ornithinimicrobium murale]|uniref:branched-chain amino acid ABC transporter permease n=1 Tax=Ornithinimicrobium murale TaxID=1050153 RepID=UPI001EDDED9B|nr:branched-chain amino acid ABC transporter permease [Ornithinimicrobium murale]